MCKRGSARRKKVRMDKKKKKKARVGMAKSVFFFWLIVFEVREGPTCAKKKK